MDGVTPGRIVHFVSDRWATGSAYTAVGNVAACDEAVDVPEFITHYVHIDEGEHVPAIITHVPANIARVEPGDGSSTDERVWLSVNFPGVSTPISVLAAYDDKGLKPGTWHWIERA